MSYCSVLVADWATVKQLGIGTNKVVLLIGTSILAMALTLRRLCISYNLPIYM
jgi:hypothetical protein